MLQKKSSPDADANSGSTNRDSRCCDVHHRCRCTRCYVHNISPIALNSLETGYQLVESVAIRIVRMNMQLLQPLPRKSFNLSHPPFMGCSLDFLNGSRRR
jgi:hypothetical protein